jgi:hypothetical protein
MHCFGVYWYLSGSIILELDVDSFNPKFRTYAWQVQGVIALLYLISALLVHVPVKTNLCKGHLVQAHPSCELPRSIMSK